MRIVARSIRTVSNQGIKCPDEMSKLIWANASIGTVIVSKAEAFNTIAVCICTTISMQYARNINCSRALIKGRCL